MKRFIISIITLCMWAISLHAQSGEFDPVNPGDPQPFYILQVNVSPSAGGTANITRTMVTAGQEVTLHIEPKADFSFQQWVCGDSVLTNNAYCYFTMPARNVVITAQLLYNPGAFNPESPGDPQGQGAVATHRVTIYTSPSVGGRTNRSSFRMEEGAQQDIYAYPNVGYEFEGWMQNGVMFSTRNPLRIEMGETDLNYTAIFTFNPLSPEDPNANSWDESTGAIVIDRFVAGKLNSAIANLLGSNSYSLVQSVVVVGQMAVEDVGVFQDMPSCRHIDISRSNGLNIIPEWAFSNLRSLQTLMLPPSVEKIEKNAFYGSNNISEIIMYAITPPAVEENALEILSSSVTVRVPASALGLYQTSTDWSRFNLVALDARNLTISLPEDALDGRYKNMILELESQQSGQIQKYLITERNTYTFSNLFKNSNYVLSVKNSRGMQLGAIDNIAIEDQDVTLSFDSLLVPKTLTLKIVTPEEEDVTSSATITWSDENGNYLQKGSVLTNVIEGIKVFYNVTLNAEKYSLYEELSKESIVINREQELIEKYLTKRSTTTLSGTVVSSTSLSPVKGVYVSIAQSLNGKNSNVYLAETDKDGYFSVEVLNANTTLYFTDDSYLKLTLTVDASQLGTLDTIKMQPLRGTTLYVVPQYIESVLHNEVQKETNCYADYANIDFSVYNETQNKPMQAVVKYPIVTLPEKIALGDSLTVTATSRNHKFNSSKVGARIDSTLYLQINVPITQLGAVSATHQQSDVDDIAALLFNNQGNLVKKKVFDGHQEVTFDYLDDGNYTILCIENLNPFNSISRLSEFVSSLLKEGKDYLLEVVSVSSGWISTAQFTNVPAIDRVILYAGEKMHFSTTTTQTIVGNYITMKALVDFKKEYLNNISEVRLVFDLPENTEFVNGSVVLGGKIGGEYTLSDGRLTIPIPRTNLNIMFCVIPFKEGIYTPCAYVKFKVGEEEKQLPISSAYYEVNGLTLNVPKVSSSKTITVRGTAIPNSIVEVYADDELVGTARSNGKGSWVAECTFRNPANLAIMKVYASAVDKNGIKHISETYDCQYDQDAIEVSKVTMYHWNSYMQRTYEVLFDFQNPKNKPANYYYYIETKFDFDIDFTSNDTAKISNVRLYVKTSDGSWNSLPANYDEDKGKWVASGDFNTDHSYALPANVAVDFLYNNTRRSDRGEFDSAIDNIISFENEINNYKDSIQTIDSLNTKDSLQIQQQIILYEQLLEKINLERGKENPNENLIDSLYKEYLAIIGVGEAIEELLPMSSEFDIDSLLNHIDSLLAQYDSVYEDSIITYYDELINEILLQDSIDIDDYELGDVSDTIYIEDNGTITRVYKTSYQSYLLTSTIDTSWFVHVPMTEGRDVLSYSDDNRIVILDIERDMATIYEDVNKTGSLSPRKIATATSSFEDFIDKSLTLLQTAINALLAWKDKMITPIEQGIERLTEKITMINKELLNLNAEAAAAAIKADNLEKQIQKLQLCKKGTLPREMLSKIDAQIAQLRAQRETAIAKHNHLTLKKDVLTDRLNTYKKSKLIKTIALKGILEQLGFIYELYHLYDLGTQMRTDGRTWDAFIKSIKCDEDKDNADRLVTNSELDKKQVQSYYRVSLGVSAITTIVNNLVKLNRVADFFVGAISTFIQQTADWNFQRGKDLSNKQLRQRRNEQKQLKCKKEDDEPEGEESGNEDAKNTIDPAGFVYEGVEDNRVEGVTATIFYKDSVTNEFGERAELEIMWDASEYDQENPLYTDENGFYQWFVPQGLWQVRFEKEGYEPTQSEWLPVPPPQLEVNIPIVQLRQPEVINAIAHKDAIDISFNKYMTPSLLNTDNVFVTANGQKVAGTLTLLDEQHPYGETTTSYASKIRFVPAEIFTAPEITLTVSNRVRSYADVPMAQTFQQSFDVEGISVMEKVQTPIPSIASGTQVELGTELTLTCATEGATIRYTMDGTTPDCLHGMIYGSSIMLYGKQDVTIRAIACADGYEPSEVVQWTYIVGENLQALHSLDADHPKPVKVVKNGHLYILMPDGRRCTILGQEIR